MIIVLLSIISCATMVSSDLMVSESAIGKNAATMMAGGAKVAKGGLASVGAKGAGAGAVSLNGFGKKGGAVGGAAGAAGFKKRLYQLFRILCSCFKYFFLFHSWSGKSWWSGE